MSEATITEPNADGAKDNGAVAKVDPVVEEGWMNLAKAQAEFEPLVMDKENPHFKSKYASLKTTLAATRPSLNKYGLVLTTAPRIDGDEIVVETKVVYKGRVIVSGTWPIGKRTLPPQPQGSANTYARRYSIQDLLGVSAEEDDDGNAAQDANARGNAAKAETKKTHNFKMVKPLAKDPFEEDIGF